MKRKFNSALLLIAAIFLAFPAWADLNGKSENGPVISEPLAGQEMVTAQTEASSPVPEGVKSADGKDALSAYDSVAPNVEAPPATEAVPEAESNPEAKSATEAENPAAVESSPQDEVAPEGGGEPEEFKQEEEIQDTTIADPIEPWNRLMFHFNDKLYFWALKPVCRGYNAVVPEPVRVSVRDFFRNAAMPVRFVGSLFQAKFKGAGTELARFTINTTLGLAGFFDVAKSWFNLDPSEEDIGQTLGSYGMGGMMYIVWPFIGPSTVRDTLGFAGDSFLEPINYVNPFYIPLGVTAYDRVNKTSLDLKTYDELVESAVEPYTALRDAYIQNRNSLIRK